VATGPAKGLAYQAAIGLSSLFYLNLILLVLNLGLPLLFFACWIGAVLPMVVDLATIDEQLGGGPVVSWALMGLLASPLIVPYYVYKRGKMTAPAATPEPKRAAYYYALLVVGPLTAVSYLMVFGQIFLSLAGLVGGILIFPGQILLTLFGLLLSIGLVLIDVTELGGSLAGNREYVWVGLAFSPPVIWLPVYLFERSRV
jgi:hypothetical protein